MPSIVSPTAAIETSTPVSDSGLPGSAGEAWPSSRPEIRSGPSPMRPQPLSSRAVDARRIAAMALRSTALKRLSLTIYSRETQCFV